MKDELFPVRIFYDGSCPFCRSLVRRWKRRDEQGHLIFVNFAGPEFVAGNYGLDPVRLQQSIHVEATDGRIFRGIDGIRVIWSAFPSLAPLVLLTGFPIIHRLAGLAYHWVARSRHAQGCACRNDRST